MLKEQGHVTVNKPVISIIYIVSRTWPLCSAEILVDGVNPLTGGGGISTYFQTRTCHFARKIGTHNSVNSGGL